MKKTIKLISIVIISIIAIILLDTIQALIFNNNPIIKIKEYYNDRDLNYKSKGILVDTINCTNGKKDTVIKGFSYSCSQDKEDYILIDKTKNIKDFACNEALESFYENKEYIYYWDCIKNSYMIVKYNNGKEETISNALKENKIDIQILDKFNINYIKETKEIIPNSKIKVIKSINNNSIAFNTYLERDNKIIYLSNTIEEIYYNEKSLKEYLKNSYQTIDDGIKNLTDQMHIYGELNDGGTKIYKLKENNITLIKCNTVYGNKNIYIGDYSLEYDEKFMCK